MRLYYMTNARWADVILKERRLKLSRFYESNDPFELMLIDSRPQDTRKIATKIADYYNKNIGMICFSASWIRAGPKKLDRAISGRTAPV